MPSIDTTNVAARTEQGTLVARIRCPKVSDFESPGILADLKPALAAHAGRLVVDLAEVTLISSAGLGMLIQLKRECDGAKGKLAICGVSEEIMGLFKLTNLHRMFTIKPDLAQAKSAVQ
jgi:anti-sigma B factor antagonist